MLIVQKFGGSSVADSGKIERAARIIADSRAGGNELVVVLSAQGDTTDELLKKALELNPEPPARELDALLAVGEQISVSLMAMQLEKMGLPAVSLTGWQLGLQTDGVHGAARILTVPVGRIRRELDAGKIVIVAGFQGVDALGDITTLGRGGSDTTAVAIAAALRADKCLIYTDVDGIFTADPRRVPSARRLGAVDYDEMLELAALGSQVLHSRCVDLARRRGVKPEVLSSAGGGPGTPVTRRARAMEELSITGMTEDAGAVLISVTGLSSAGSAGGLFRALGDAEISADMVTYPPGGDSVCFTVADGDEVCARRAIASGAAGASVSVDGGVTKVSIVGSGLTGSPGVAARLLAALYESGVEVLLLSTGAIKLSALVPVSQSDRAVAAIHREFFGTSGV